MGMLGFIIFLTFSKLYRFKGTKLKVRLSYALALSLFFTLFYLWQTKGNSEIIFRGIILGIVLGVPFCLHSRRWIDKKIEGTKIYYKKKNVYINYLWGILGVILVQVLMVNKYGKILIESIWPVLGLCFSWFFSQVFMFYYVVKLERELGSPILEDNKVNLKQG